MRSTACTLMIISLLVGCSQQSPVDTTATDYPELTTLSTAEVARLASSTDQPVIVEFSVLMGCDRCARMRPQVCALARAHADQMSIVRADFTTNQQLLQSLGATVCPTYVLFAPGSQPQIHTSPELLVSMAGPSSDSLTNMQLQ